VLYVPVGVERRGESWERRGELRAERGESMNGSLRSGLVRVAGLVSIGFGLRSDDEGEMISSACSSDPSSERRLYTLRGLAS
jgi:hypothetical protein